MLHLVTDNCCHNCYNNHFSHTYFSPSSSFLFDRVIATTRNKQQQRFCEFIKPFLDLLFDLHLKVSDFEQLKIIGRGAFGQVALVKVSVFMGDTLSAKSGSKSDFNLI